MNNYSTLAIFVELVHSFSDKFKTDLAGSYTVDSIRGTLNTGISTLADDLLQRLSIIIPDGEYECLLPEIHPYQICFSGKGDYFKEERVLYGIMVMKMRPMKQV